MTFLLGGSPAEGSPASRSGPQQVSTELTWKERGPSQPASCAELLQISSVSAVEVHPLISLAQSSFTLAQTPLVALSQELEDPLFAELPLIEQYQFFAQKLSDSQSHLRPLLLLDTSAVPSLHLELDELKRLYTSVGEDFRRIQLSGMAQANYLMQQNTLLILRNLKHLLREQVGLIQLEDTPVDKMPQHLYVLASYVDLLVQEKLSRDQLESLSGYHSIFLMIFQELTALWDQADEAAEVLDPTWRKSLKFSLENSHDRLRLFQAALEAADMSSMLNGRFDSPSYLQINRESYISLQENVEELRKLAQNFLMSPDFK